MARLLEEPSSSSVDDMEEHTSQSLERVGTSPSQDDIEDYSQVDQSKGLAKAWQRIMNVQAVTACHGKAHYTPVVKLKTSLIPQKILKFLRACSRAKVKCTSITMVGGDQRCESQVASLIRMLRRCNMLGRSICKTSRCHIDVLSSRFLQEHLGLEKITAAVKAYQDFYQNTVSPKDLWKQTSLLDAEAP